MYMISPWKQGEEGNTNVTPTDSPDTANLMSLIDISTSFNKCLQYVKMSTETCSRQWTSTILKYKYHQNQRLDIDAGTIGAGMVGGGWRGA